MTRIVRRLQDLDLSGVVIEAHSLLALQKLTNLTALYLSQMRVLSAKPLLAGLLLARAVAPLTTLQRVALGSFASSSEAALAGAGALCPHALTFLDIGGALNKCTTGALDFEALAALTGLQELRSVHASWWAQGVPASAVANVLAAMPNLSCLALSVPEAESGVAWVAAALAAVSDGLRVLCLKGALSSTAAQDDSSAAGMAGVQRNNDAHAGNAGNSRHVHGQRAANGSGTDGHTQDNARTTQTQQLRAKLAQLGALRFPHLEVLVCQCEEAPPTPHCADDPVLAQDLGLPRGARLLCWHAVLKDSVPRGGIAWNEDHPHDMRAIFRKYGGERAHS